MVEPDKTPMKYIINISEILQADVVVEASDEAEAIQKVTDMYARCEVILTADEFIEGGCPQIIDRETYDTVQRRITENKHTGGKNIAKEVYLLSGKVFCVDCGKSMVINRRKSGRNNDSIHVTYRCQTKRYSCSNKEINRKFLDEYVIALLECEIFNPKPLRQICRNIKRYLKSDNRADSLDNIKEKLMSTNTAL